MIQALNSLGNSAAFETARWYPKNKHEYELIKVEIVTENEQRWSPVVSQLLGTDSDVGLKTSYANNYQIGQSIYYRNKCYQIERIGEISLDVNPQALAISLAATNKQTILALVEIKQK